MKCKLYSEITVEIRTQLKIVNITSNIFAVRSMLELVLKMESLFSFFLFSAVNKIRSKLHCGIQALCSEIPMDLGIVIVHPSLLLQCLGVCGEVKLNYCSSNSSIYLPENFS